MTIVNDLPIETITLKPGAPTAADRYERWCDDLVADHLERQADERNDR